MTKLVKPMTYVNGIEVPLSPDGIPMMPRDFIKQRISNGHITDKHLNRIAGKVYSNLHPGANYLIK